MQQKINIYRGFKGCGFSMTEKAIRGMGHGGLLHDFHDRSDLDSYSRWVVPLPTQGMWTCGPEEASPRHNLRMVLREGDHDIFRSNKAVLVLDAAGEGFPPDSSPLRNLTETFRDLEIPKGNVIYLTASTDGPAVYEQWCARNNLEPSFTVMAFPMQLYYFSGVYREAGGLANYEFRYETANAARRENIRRPKHFLCLNYTPRPGRYATMLYLMAHDLMDKGQLSFFGPVVNNGPHDAGWASEENIASELRKLGMDERYVALLPKLNSMCPITFEDSTGSDRFGLAYNIQDFNMYKDTYFSLVTESDTFGYAGVRLTEKTLKPLANFHPFIVIGPKGVLREVRRLGFRTFEGFIDESYDEIDDDHERLMRALEMCKRLTELNLDDMHKLYYEMWDTLVHNFMHFSFGAREQLVYEPVIQNIMGRAL